MDFSYCIALLFLVSLSCQEKREIRKLGNFKEVERIGKIRRDEEYIGGAPSQRVSIADANPIAYLV